MRYLKLLHSLLKVNFSKTLTYKGHFVAETINSMGWAILSIVTILLLTSKVPVVFGWTRNELILLSVMINIIYGVLRILFDPNFWRFSEIIHKGQLDSVLLKPVDSQFQMSIWLIDFSAILRFVFAIILVIYLIFLFHIQVSISSILLASLLCIAGVAMLYSISFMFLTISIWFSNLYNLMNLVNTLIGASRYPKEMYANLSGFVFFFLLPVILIIGTPTKALIQKASLADSLLLVTFAVLFLFASRVFWKFALRFYASASG